MTNTTVNANIRVKQFDDKHHAEYIRSNRFKKYMGTSQNSIIQLKEDLSKKKGDAITIPLVGALDASGGYNTGSTTLVGSEKSLPNDGHMISVGVVRDAIVVNVEEEQASPIDIRNAGKVALKDLQMRYLRNDIINGFGSVGGVNYAPATTAQRNAWLVKNADRVLFGDSTANAVAGNHASSLSAVTAGMKLTRDMVSEMRAIARDSKAVNGDGIRPFTYGEDEETFVLFAGSKDFRNLKNDMEAVHTDAQNRGKGNPLFTGTTSLYWDGVVIREIPEIGEAATGKSPVYLCGSQALAVAWASRTKTTTRQEDDYGFQHGVGFQEIRGVNKIQYDGVDWGMVTGFVSN